MATVRVSDVSLRTDDKSGGTAVGSCARCGEPFYAQDTFCTACGAKLVQRQPAGDARSLHAPTRHCTACGSVLYVGFKYCTQCGEPVLEKPQDAAGEGLARVAPAGAKELPYAPAEVLSTPAKARGAVLPAPASRANKPAASEYENDDDPTLLARLVTLTHDEAAQGCVKELVLGDGQCVRIDVPAGTHVGTRVDVPGYGLVDERTGERGMLRVSFYVPPCNRRS